MSKSKLISRQQTGTKKSEQQNVTRSPIDKVGIGLITLSAVGFSTLGLFTKLAYTQGLNPLSTLFWRLAGSAAILWIWLLLNRKLSIKKGNAVAAFCLGASVYALQANLFFRALTHASAGITTLLFYTYPAFVAVWSYLLTRTKPVSLRSWQGKALILTFLGCLLTVDFSSQTAQPLGIVLGIASGAGYGLYLFCSSYLVKTVKPIEAAAYMLLGSAFTIAIVVISGQALIIPTTKSSILIVSGLALISTALPTITLFLGLKRLEVLPAAIFSTLEPILAVFMGIIFLQEQFWLGQALGGLLIICSAVILQSKLK